MTDSKPKLTLPTDEIQSDTTKPATPQPREIPSQELFQGSRSIIITHSGEHYRLMITRNDKLILQK